MSEGKFFYHRQHVHHTHEVPNHHEHPDHHLPKHIEKPYERENVKAAIQRAAAHWKHGTQPTHHLKCLDNRNYMNIIPAAAPALSADENTVIRRKKQAYRVGTANNPRKTNKELLDVIQRNRLRRDRNETPEILKDKQIIAFNELTTRFQEGTVLPTDLTTARNTLIQKAQADPQFIARYNAINPARPFDQAIRIGLPPAQTLA